jgi:hypothetical protein
MQMHVRRECDPKTHHHSGSLCGVSPRLTQAGYNPEWELVYQLDTLLAIRRQDVCSACLRAIDALKKNRSAVRPSSTVKLMVRITHQSARVRGEHKSGQS